MLTDTLARYVLQDYPLDARLTAGASELGYSRAKWAQLADLGLMGALFSEDDGGYGGQGFDLAVVFEGIGRGLIVEPLLGSAVLGGGILANAGDTLQKELIEQLISGEKQAAFAHFEAGDGWDATHIQTTAEKTDTGWVLNGAKAVVRGASSADFLVVSARSSGSAGDETGLSLFLLPRDCDGVSMRDYTTIDGGRAAEIRFDNTTLGAAALIGTQGDGFGPLTVALGRGLLCLSAEALGIMETIKDMTIEYLRTRKQFGVPIGKFQALQHRMADVLLEIEQARAAVINAAAHVDKPGLAREKAASAAKFTLSQVGTLVAEESIQMHGGMGMTWEYPLGHYVKRLVMIGHELGDEDFHLTRYMALGKGV